MEAISKNCTAIVGAFSVKEDAAWRTDATGMGGHSQQLPRETSNVRDGQIEGLGAH